MYGNCTLYISVKKDILFVVLRQYPQKREKINQEEVRTFVIHVKHKHEHNFHSVTCIQHVKLTNLMLITTEPHSSDQSPYMAERFTMHLKQRNLHSWWMYIVASKSIPLHSSTSKMTTCVYRPSKIIILSILDVIK